MARISPKQHLVSSADEEHVKSDGVSALERGFRVLDCFVAASKPLSNSEVAELTGIPRPSVTRLIATLVALGHLRPAQASERWELAAGVVRLARSFLGTLNIRDYAREHLRSLAEAIDASSFLGVRDGLDVLVVEAARSSAAVAVMSADVGTRMSLARSALGRAWLLGLDPESRAVVLGQLQAADVVTDKQKMALSKSLASTQELGYIVSVGEWHPAINAAAVPVCTADGQIVSLNCGGPAFMLTEAKLRGWVVPRLLQAAQALAHDIGGLAGPALTCPSKSVEAKQTLTSSIHKTRQRPDSTKETKRNGADNTT